MSPDLNQEARLLPDVNGGSALGPVSVQILWMEVASVRVTPGQEAVVSDTELSHFSRYAMPDGVERWGSVDRGNPGHTEDVKKF